MTQTLAAREWRLDVTPETPLARAPVKLVLQVPDGATPPTEAHVWEVDRTHAPGVPSRRAWHALDGPRTLALQVWPPRALPLRVGVPVGDATLWFTIPVGAAAAPAPAPEPPERGALSMTVQHEAMARLGEHWAAAGRALDREAPDLDGAREPLREARGWAALTPHFALHRATESIDEFRALAGDFTQRLDRLDAAVRGGDATAARERYRETDAWACLRCHVKFRWGTVKDISRFPDLTNPEKRR